MTRREKHENFRRLAQARTNNIIDGIRKLGNLSNRNNYEYTTAEWEKVFLAIQKNLDRTRSKFRYGDNDWPEFTFSREEPTVNFHISMPRHLPDRYIEVTKEPHPRKADWWMVSMAIHDGEAEIVIETMDQAMTPEGARSRAAELAQSKGIQDVIML